MRTMLKKDREFEWSFQQQKSFEQLQRNIDKWEWSSPKRQRGQQDNTHQLWCI